LSLDLPLRQNLLLSLYLLLGPLLGIAASFRMVFFDKTWEASHHNTIFARGFRGLPFLVLLSFKEE